MRTYWCGNTHTCLYAYGYLGQQLWNAALNGKTLDVAALLSNPEARSFINGQNEVACPTSPTPLLASTLCFSVNMLAHCVSVHIIAYISL